MSGGRVVVTGASGFTGKHACRLLAAAGWEVIAVGSPRTAPQFWPDTGASAGVRCDLTDRTEVDRLIARLQPAALLHLAGCNEVASSWRDPAHTMQVNVMSTVCLLEAVRASCPDCRIVVAGSMLRPSLQAASEALHPYAFSKALQVMSAASWHRWYHLHVTIADPTNLIGPGGSNGICGKIARWVARTEAGLEAAPFTLSSTGEERDYLDVRDAVSAYEILLRSGTPGTIYEIASGIWRTLNEVRSAFDEVARVPLDWKVGNAKSAGASGKLTESGNGAAPICRLGWQRRIPFHQSIRDALEEERARVHSCR